MAFLTPDNIRTEHGLVIKEKIIPWGAVWPKDSGKFKKGDLYKADRLLSGGTGKVAYVTIHNTADIQEAAGTNDAEQYVRATWPNCNMNDSRVHYFIDETDCWQNLREDEVGWHAGDGRGPGNESSLAIEIIMDGSGSAADKSAEDRGALLAAILLDKHGLGIDRLTTHKRWSGKDCPTYILPHWSQFKAKVETYLKQIQSGTAAQKPQEAPESAAKYYRIRKTWKDKASQKGAYLSLANALANCPAGYTVFDWNGKAVSGTEKSSVKWDPAGSFNKAQAGTYKVSSSDGTLNLRSGAGTDKTLIETMPNGTLVRCYGYYTGDWLCVVSAAGNTGYCHSGYLVRK